MPLKIKKKKKDVKLFSQRGTDYNLFLAIFSTAQEENLIFLSSVPAMLSQRELFIVLLLR